MMIWRFQFKIFYKLFKPFIIIKIYLTWDFFFSNSQNIDTSSNTISIISLIPHKKKKGFLKRKGLSLTLILIWGPIFIIRCAKSTFYLDISYAFLKYINYSMVWLNCTNKSFVVWQTTHPEDLNSCHGNKID